MPTTCLNCGLSLGAGDGFCGNCGQAAPPDDPAAADAGLYAAPAGSGSFTDIVGEPTFDPIRNKRFLWQVARRFLLFFLVYLVLDLVVLFFGLILSLLGAVTLAFLVQVVSTLIGIGVFVAFVLMPVPALLAYGSKIVSGRGPSAPRAFECIRESFDRHATPRDSLQARSLPLPGEERRQYLELRRGAFAGYISCFPHGRDLYFSWTFWIYMSPLRLVLMRIGRVFQSLQGRGNDLHQSLRYESVRATVGAIQICTTEGVEAALSETADGEPFSLAGGASVPIG